ncbi:MAG: acetylglutamate kinase [Clostridia bacterium]|nr:acetylglutamate kinase [Clostridia bacterium]MBQ2948580.1 acetylglutamate kinase [Clostridia bacterium]MBQ7051940.1 acetylglutamate kinase [Clostridia bacterium]
MSNTLNPVSSDTVFMNKANILVEALPYIQRLWGKIVVIKYGGNAMKNDDLTHKILQDVTLLKYVGINPILVHGGGPEINTMLKRVGVESHFHNGLRITDDATMEIVQMVLAGKLNKNIASDIGRLGGKAIGLCGKDAELIKVTKKPPLADGVDLGHVGDIVSINAKLLHTLCSSGYIPVISSVGTDENGESYNINADTAASAVATAMKAEKLIFLTDIDGVRADADDPSSLFPVLTTDQSLNLIAEGVITGGMIPKVTACIDAIEKGVRRVHIINGTIPHPIILEIFTDKGIGTMFEKPEFSSKEA